MGLLRKKSNQNHFKIFQNPRYRFSALGISMGLLRKKSNQNHHKIFLKSYLSIFQ